MGRYTIPLAQCSHNYLVKSLWGPDCLLCRAANLGPLPSHRSAAPAPRPQHPGLSAVPPLSYWCHVHVCLLSPRLVLGGSGGPCYRARHSEPAPHHIQRYIGYDLPRAGQDYRLLRPFYAPWSGHD